MPGLGPSGHTNGYLFSITKGGVVCKVGLAVVETTVLNDDLLRALQLHRILRFQRYNVAAHMLRNVHTETLHALGLNDPFDLIVGILVCKEQRYLDLSDLVGIVDADHTLMSLQNSFTLGRKLTVGNDPILLSYNVSHN